MPKKPTLQQSFTQQFPSMKSRVDAKNKGFTLRQSKLALLMLTYLQERETTLAKEVKQANAYAEGSEDWAKGLAHDWNALTNFLSELFKLRAYSDDMVMEGDKRVALWTVECPGGKLTGYRTIPEAFKAGIEAQLKGQVNERKS